MGDSSVVVQQRLSTGGIVTALGAVLALFAIIGVFIAGALSGPVPQPILDVAYAVVLVFVVLMVLASRIEVRVTQSSAGRALEVLYGPGGHVRQVFSASRIVAATCVNTSDTQMLAWGYRGSLRWLRRATLTTRRGAALDLLLVGDQHFVVTVAEPEAFVAALDSYCEAP